LGVQRAGGQGGVKAIRNLSHQQINVHTRAVDCSPYAAQPDERNRMAEGTRTEIPLEELLLAGVVLRLADREERLSGATPVRSEVLLAEAGLALATIAQLTGKNYEAVKASVRRARGKAAARRDT
jgi:DNA-directed RNA polymerase specialized sigma24 family protein